MRLVASQSCKDNHHIEMKQGYLLFVPAGGLANRMRAIASAYHLSSQTQTKVQVVWFQDWGMNAAFHDLFRPIETKTFKIKEANWIDLITIDRPRKRNFFVPRIFQFIRFNQRIDEQYVADLKSEAFDFERWTKDKNSYMSCYDEFGTFNDSLYVDIFKPLKEISNRVEGYKKRFSPHTIGMHIRRTDNLESIEKSPLNLFVDTIKQEIKTHADTKIFLATDDQQTKSTLMLQFGERILTSREEATRGNLVGITDGLADMLTLASTQMIYGSAGSSFSEMASKIGNTPLYILSVPQQ